MLKKTRERRHQTDTDTRNENYTRVLRASELEREREKRKREEATNGSMDIWMDLATGYGSLSTSAIKQFAHFRRCAAAAERCSSYKYTLSS